MNLLLFKVKFGGEEKGKILKVPECGKPLDHVSYINFAVVSD